MQLSTTELALAREATESLLDQLGLQAYLFEIELGEDRWEVRVECATDGGWEVVNLSADRSLLTARDHAALGALLQQWREKVAACKAEQENATPDSAH